MSQQYSTESQSLEPVLQCLLDCKKLMVKGIVQYFGKYVYSYIYFAFCGN